MEDYKLALVTLETEDITVAEGESSLEPCDIEDPTVPTLETIWPPQQLTPPAAPPATALPAALSAAFTVAPMHSGKFLLKCQK